MSKENRLYSGGEVLTSKSSGDYEVLEYLQRGRYLVRFLATRYTKQAATKEVRNGSVKDPYFPNIACVGFVGEGDYRPITHNKIYDVWRDMLRRCYTPSSTRTAKDYAGCTVCKHWHNFQNFAKWADNRYSADLRLDKDLLVLGNKIYSPETCVFVPVEINSFFTGGLKRGIHYNNLKGAWIAQCQDGEVCSTGKKKQTYLGCFKDEQEALLAYKSFKKEKLSKLVVSYKDLLPEQLVSSMYQKIDDLK